MDMSLDDIINTRRDNKGSVRGRRRPNIRKPDLGRKQLNGRANQPGIRRAGSNISSQNRRQPGASRATQSNIRDQKPIIDARSKIIEKNRQKMADARDKLAEIAKKSDARLKLLKLKQSKVTARPSPARSTNLRNNTIRTRISLTSPRQNLRLQLSRDRFGRGGSRVRLDLGSKNEGRNRLSESPRGANLKRSINNDLITRNRNQGLRLNFRGEGRGNFNRPLLKRSVDNDDIEVVGNPIFWKESNTNKGVFRSVPLMRRPQEGVFQRNNFLNTFSNDGNFRNNLDYEEELRGNDEVLMRSFSNRGRSEMDNFPMKMSRPSQIKVVMHNDSSSYIQKQQHQMMEVEDEYEHYFKQPAQPLALAKPSRSFIGHMPNQGSEEGHLIQAIGGPRMSQEMLARLDTPAPVPRSMGILSTQGPQPASMNADIGHRIVVSNLQPSVTHEDIKELFEDIGPLLASRVVRAGTAEVIYNLQKDAKKAVEAYHNRQLDGQPMKCMLVNPRALPMNQNSIGGLRSPALHAKIPSSSKSSVMPDLTAIHKALFSK